MSVEAGGRCERMRSHSEVRWCWGSELNVSASGVAEGVFTFVLVPSHCGCSSAQCSKVGSCSSDVRVRCCRV